MGTTTESSASVQRLLIHLERAGLDGAPRFHGVEPDGSMVLSWVEQWVPAGTERWRLGRSELASVGELLRSYCDCVAGFAPGTGFEEGPKPSRRAKPCATGVWHRATACF